MTLYLKLADSANITSFIPTVNASNKFWDKSLYKLDWSIILRR